MVYVLVIRVAATSNDNVVGNQYFCWRIFFRGGELIVVFALDRWWGGGISYGYVIHGGGGYLLSWGREGGSLGKAEGLLNFLGQFAQL